MAAASSEFGGALERAKKSQWWNEADNEVICSSVLYCMLLFPICTSTFIVPTPSSSPSMSLVSRFHQISSPNLFPFFSTTSLTC